MQQMYQNIHLILGINSTALSLIYSVHTKQQIIERQIVQKENQNDIVGNIRNHVLTVLLWYLTLAWTILHILLCWLA